ncbi:MAG TPA: hypothetical protein VIR60_11250 [Gammaproteobacteria bacterium]
MRIRCQHLGITAALALALSVAAADWSAADPAAVNNAPVTGQATLTDSREDVSPVPAPVLFLAGGLLAVAGMVRWRQRFRP